MAGPGSYAGNIIWPQVAGIALLGEAGPGSTVIDGAHWMEGIRLEGVPGASLVSGLTIRNCNSDGAGGGIYANLCTLSVVNCRISDNVSRLGGGISCDYGSILVRRCIVTGNLTSLYPPGGIALGWGAQARIDSSTVAGNSGGVYAAFGDQTVIRHCNITGNSAFGVSCDYAPALDAEYNWWGDATGPYHPSSNPLGRGDTVGDRVDFDPWLAAGAGIAEHGTAPRPCATPATFARGTLFLPASGVLLDASGRNVLDLAAGANDVSRLASGVYFVRSELFQTSKVVITR